MTSKVVLLGAIALILIFVGAYTPWLQPLRSQFGAVNTPFYWIADLPSRFSDWVGQRFTSKADVLAENESLKAELLIHKRKLQQMAPIYAENLRFKEMMNTVANLNERVELVEIIGVSPDPLTHRVIINKGEKDGVRVDQPLMDADGLMGQVVEVGPYSSQVLLLTDSTNALQVQVNRNEIRAVIEGLGDFYEMSLRHVELTADIQVDDLLVTSGFGGVFPFGLPVARVISVQHLPGQSFATIKARPLGKLNRGRHALLLFQQAPVNGQQPKDQAPVGNGASAGSPH